MSSLATCIRKAGKAVSRDDAGFLRQAHADYVDQGVGGTEASLQAIADLIAMATTEHNELSAEIASQGGVAPQIDQRPRYSLEEEIEEPAPPKTKAQDLQETMDRVTAHWLHNITVHKTQAELFKALPHIERQFLAKKTEGMVVPGVYDQVTQQAYIVAENIRDDQHAMKVLFEEVIGHRGMRVFMGDEFDSFLDDIYAVTGPAKLAAIVKNYRINLETKAGQREAVEEYIAQMGPQDATVWQMFTSWVRGWFRSTFGVPMAYSDNELRNIMEKVRENMQFGLLLGSGVRAYSKPDGGSVRVSMVDGIVMSEEVTIPEDPAEEDLPVRTAQHGELSVTYTEGQNNGQPMLVVRSTEGPAEALMAFAASRNYQWVDQEGKVTRTTAGPVPITPEYRWEELLLDVGPIAAAQTMAEEFGEGWRDQAQESTALFSLISPGTPEFETWFSGASEYFKNSDGSPRLYLHGTTATKVFDEFEPGWGNATFFAPATGDLETVDVFAGVSYAAQDDETVDPGRTIPAFINAQNVWDFRNPANLKAVMSAITAATQDYRQFTASEALEAVKSGHYRIIEKNLSGSIQRAGFDAYMVHETLGDVGAEPNVAVFNPGENVRSPFNAEPISSTPRFSLAPSGEVTRTTPIRAQQRWEELLPDVGPMTDKMKASVMQGQARFSFATAADARIDQLLKQHIVPSNKAHLTYKERWTDIIEGFKASVWDDRMWKFKQGAIDSAAPAERYEVNLHQQILDAAEGAYKMIGLTKNLPGVMQAVFKLGIPERRNGSFVPVEGRIGLQEIFKDLFGEENLMYQFEGYLTAYRANELINLTNRDGSPRETNMDQETIDELLALDERHDGLFSRIRGQWKEFNDDLIRFAVSEGVLDEATGEMWTQHMWVPFYRAVEDLQHEGDIGTGIQRKRGLDGQSVRSRRLTGADARVNKPFENMILNTAMVMDKIYKNEAMKRLFDLTMGIGMELEPHRVNITRLSNQEIGHALAKAGLVVGKVPGEVEAQGAQAVEGYLAARGAEMVTNMTDEEREQFQTFFRMEKPAGPDIVSVVRDGKQVYAKVTDPDLLRMIEDMHPTRFGKLMETLLVTPRHILTHMVTNDPGFMVANYLRDLMSTFVVSEYASANPLEHIRQSIEAAIELTQGTDLVNKLMMAGGLPMGYYNPVGEDIAGELEREIKNKGWKNIGPRKLYRMYRKLGAVSEQANRLVIAKNVLKAGGSMAEAAWQAQDVLNFSQHGEWSSMQFLARTVPFLNARIQGMYKLYRGAMARPGDNSIGKFKTAFLMKGAMITAATLALMLDNDDREEYQRLPEVDRDMYYHWFTDDGEHYALPKPFEVGVLFSTVAERLWMLSKGKDDASQAWGSALRTVLETFAMNPTPQLFKPMIEQWANKSMFTGRPIVSMNLRGLKPEAQYSPYTSETARRVGQITADLVPEGMKVAIPDFLMSPVRIEHNVRAYTGTLGMYMLQISDNLARMIFDLPAAPTPTIPSFAGPLSPIAEGAVRRFIRPDTEVEGRNRYANELYDVLDKANALTRTYNAYRLQGRHQAASEMLQAERPLFALKARMNEINKQLRNINTKMRRVRYHPTLSGDEKREQLNRLTERRNRLLMRVEPLLQWIR